MDKILLKFAQKIHQFIINYIIILILKYNKKRKQLMLKNSNELKYYKINIQIYILIMLSNMIFDLL